MEVTVLMLANLFVLVGSMTLTGIAATRVGLSRRSWKVRSMTLLVAGAIGMFPPLGMECSESWVEGDTVSRPVFCVLGTASTYSDSDGYDLLLVCLPLERLESPRTARSTLPRVSG